FSGLCTNAQGVRTSNQLRIDRCNPILVSVVTSLGRHPIWMRCLKKCLSVSFSESSLHSCFWLDGGAFNIGVRLINRRRQGVRDEVVRGQLVQCRLSQARSSKKTCRSISTGWGLYRRLIPSQCTHESMARLCRSIFRKARM